MRSAKTHVGVIIGVLLAAMVIVALPRSAAASGWRSGFVHPFRSFISSHRFRDFDHRFARNRLQIRRFQRRFDRTPHGRVFCDFGDARQGLHLGNTVIIFRH